MDADEVVQILENIESGVIDLVKDGWYSKERLLEIIERIIDDDT